MFVEFKDHEGNPISINSDHVVAVRPPSDRLIGFVDIIAAVQVLMNGQIAMPQFKVQGSLKEVTRKLNGEPVLSVVN